MKLRDLLAKVRTATRAREEICAVGELDASSAQSISSAATEKSPDPFHVFLEPGALAINQARLVHLASLGLELRGLRVLEVGGGIGMLTPYWTGQACEVLFTDARAENVQEAARRMPTVRAEVLDLDTDEIPTEWGQFDVVFCYGTLYHLSRPAEALEKLCAVCRGTLVLETCVTPGSTIDPHFVEEPSSVANQASSGLGCRPTRRWVEHQLRKWLPHVYFTSTQPSHHDFETDWLNPKERKLYRSVFVASRSDLQNPFLLNEPPEAQLPMRARAGDVWVDVGFHLGEKTYQTAAQDPSLLVYAFEPNPKLVVAAQGQLPNLHVLPLAVSDYDGFTEFCFNALDGCSSLLPFDEVALGDWKGGEGLQVAAKALVPVVRLDTFIRTAGLGIIDYLKIDAQGADHQVVVGSGELLKRIAKLTFEAAVTPLQLYRGAHGVEETAAYLAARGFRQIAAELQSFDQEVNATFVQGTQWDIGQVSPYVSDEAVLEAAGRCFALRAQHLPYPNFSFGLAAEIQGDGYAERRALWNAARDRKLSKPVKGPWLHGTFFNYYLGTDITYCTYIVGAFDPNEFCFLASILKPGMNVLDVGANEGLYTLFFAAAVGDAGRVVAFEPSPREFSKLTANIQLNNFVERVVLEPCAVSDKTERAVLKIAEFGHEGQNTLGDFAWEVRRDGDVEVGCVALDEFVISDNDDRFDVIKIDAEGSEYKVLLGAKELLQRDAPLLLLEINERALANQGSTPGQVFDFLAELGYECQRFSSTSGALVPFDDPQASGENVVARPRWRVAAQ